MIIYDDVIQGSPAWHELRRGRPTASEFESILTAVGKQCVLAAPHDGEHQIVGKKPKKGVARCPVLVPQISKGAIGYIARLIADVVNQSPNYFTENGNNKPPNPAMQNGTAREPEARAWFMADQGCFVQQVGFVTSDDERYGCSPDGLIIGDAGEILGPLELKCPELHTHMKWLLKNELPREHKVQVHGEMVVTGCREASFMSYHPDAQPLSLLVTWDDYTDALKVAVEAFCEMYDKALVRLLGYGFAEAMKRLHQFDTNPEANNGPLHPEPLPPVRSPA